MKISGKHQTRDVVKKVGEVPVRKNVVPLKVKNDAVEKSEGAIVSVSKRAGELEKIRKIIEKTPDVREEKTALLKKQITAGEYTVKGKDVAEKMLREFLLDEIGDLID